MTAHDSAGLKADEKTLGRPVRHDTMVPSTRRRFLRNATVVLSPLLAGCQWDSDDGETPPTRSPTSTPTPRDAGYPDVDERVDDLPPGSPALEPSGSWPSFRFDAGNTGANPGGDGVRDGTEYWRLNAGGSATVADETLYNVFGREQPPRKLTFRDPDTAAVTAETDLVRYGVNSPPVVANGRVFVTTFIEVFCFDAATSERRWRGPEMDGIQGRPTVDDGTVFVNSGGFKDVDPQFRAFDAASGEEYWRYDPGAETKSTPAVGDEHVFITTTDHLCAIHRESGDEVYSLPEVSSRWGSPVVHDGIVYAPDTDHDSDALVAIDADSGSVRWRQQVGTDSPPVVTERSIYTRTTSRTVELDREEGTVRSSESRASQPVALVGDVLYAVGKGTVYAYDVTDDLSLLWSLRTEEVEISDTIGRHVHHVTPVDGAVYVNARDAFYGIGPETDR